MKSNNINANLIRLGLSETGTFAAVRVNPITK